ncbi:NYN domain-containing protein [Limibacter armeniacum]|uniref:NYN domain-containing protein n=1 Tax=Limibacter armeniacum TaxID=466084 RepID=UPI002FE6BC94
MVTQDELRLAVLIDADNIPSANVSEMMNEIAKYGTPTFKRIYGDWTKPNLGGWKNVLLENAITPIQQYSYTSGKNATDSAMIIDAMDILYSGKVDGFCIVSSDSDFTRLATRLREAGMKVIGIGEKKTPKPFLTACDKFIYLEILSSKDEDEEEEDEKPKAGIPKAPKPRRRKKVTRIDKKTIYLIANTIDDLADDDGWALLAKVGSLIGKKQPTFDPRNFGFAKLTDLIKSLEYFEIQQRDSGPQNSKIVFVRNK